MPLGSWNQEEWCEDQGFKQTDYLQHAKLHDNRLRIAFAHATDKMPTRHVWLIYNGKTYESYGGHGVDSRAWNAKIDKGRSSLDQIVSTCFVLTDPLV
jgi:hypothetical protein